MSDKRRLIVYHRYYGCETGCCGHVVELLAPGQERGEGNRKFKFTHPYGGDPVEFAKDLIRGKFGEDHVADLDWEHCVIEEDH